MILIEDVAAEPEAQQIPAPRGVRRRDDQRTARAENAVDLAQREHRIHLQVLDHLAQEHDVEGGMGVREACGLEIEAETIDPPSLANLDAPLLLREGGAPLTQPRR